MLRAVVAEFLVAMSIMFILLPAPEASLALLPTGGAAFAMGTQAGAARHLAVKDVTTVVVTSTMVGLTSDSRFGGHAPDHPWARRLLAVVLIGPGAAAGALLLQLGLGYGPALSAVITVLVTVLGHLSRPSGRRG